MQQKQREQGVVKILLTKFELDSQLSNSNIIQDSIDMYFLIYQLCQFLSFSRFEVLILYFNLLLLLFLFKLLFM